MSIRSEEVLNKTKMKFRIMGINSFNPKTSQSKNWKNWEVHISITTCQYCKERDGKIYKIDDLCDGEPPAHEYCRCTMEVLSAIEAGTATIDRGFGADYWIRNYGSLPNTYIRKEDAAFKGWKGALGNLNKVMPNSIIGGDIYHDYKRKLPAASGRIWYEADINYVGGYRNEHRIVYSNDGLIFVTYNHYKTYMEIV